MTDDGRTPEPDPNPLPERKWVPTVAESIAAVKASVAKVAASFASIGATIASIKAKWGKPPEVAP